MPTTTSLSSMDNEARALLEAPLAAINAVGILVPFLISTKADSASETPFSGIVRLQVIEDMETTVHLLRQSGFGGQASAVESLMPTPASKKSKRSKKLKKEEGDELRRHIFGSKRHHSTPNILSASQEAWASQTPTVSPQRPKSTYASHLTVVTSYSDGETLRVPPAMKDGKMIKRKTSGLGLGSSRAPSKQDGDHEHKKRAGIASWFGKKSSTKRSVTSPAKSSIHTAPPTALPMDNLSNRSSSTSLSFHSIHSTAPPSSAHTPAPSTATSGDTFVSPAPRTSDLSTRLIGSSQSPLALMDSLDSQLTNLRMHHSTLMSLLPFTLSVARTSRLSDTRSGYLHTENKEGSTTTESSGESTQRTASSGSISPTRMHRQALRSRSRSPTHDHPAPPFTTSYPQEESPLVPTPRTHLFSDRPSNHAHRASMTSLFSDVASLYFDAEIDPDTEHQLDGQVQAAWTDSAMLAPAATTEEGIWLNDSMSEMTVAGAAPLTPLRQDSDEEAKRRRDSVATLLAPRSTAPVQRRKALPAPTPAVEPSLLGLMKKNMGKDFASISVDVSFNEPISLLQRLAETVEYVNLLTKAAKEPDSVKRMAYVAAFAVSQYANAKHRTTRKPFNPIMGETYELVREDLGFRFIAEKVVHNPPKLACRADGDGWSYWCTSGAKNKLSGLSLEMLPVGYQHIVFDNGERFSYTKPPSYLRNLMGSVKYLETLGELRVTNETTGETCIVTFQPGTWGGGASSRNRVAGVINDANHQAVGWLEGVCDARMGLKVGSSSAKLQPIWEVTPWPANPGRAYGFTKFGIELNELTPDLEDVLPPSDSRLRPDQRALEHGRFDDAERLKHALEAQQRARKAENRAFEPRWFKRENTSGVDEHTDNWEYAGGYWEAREDGTLKEKAADCFVL